MNSRSLTGCADLLSTPHDEGISWAERLHQAVSDVSIPEANRLIDGCSELQQGQWALFLRLDARQSALVVETGHGGASLSAARLFKAVAVICPSEARARLVKCRLEGAGRLNAVVTVFSGESSLPFPDAAFDAVIMHDLKCEDGTGAICPGARELTRLVRPGGLVYISANHKPGRGVLKNSVDPVANVKKGLLKGPFTQVSELQHVSEIGSAYLLRAYPPRPSPGRRSLKQIKHRLFSGNSAWVFRMGPSPAPAPRSVYDGIISRISEFTSREAMPMDQVHLGSSDCVIIATDGYIARLPLSSRADARCKNGFRTLGSLKGFDAVLRAPLAVMEDQVDGYRFYLETRVEGHEINNRKRSGKGYEDITRAAVERYFSVQRERCKPRAFDRADYERLAGAQIDLLSHCIGDAHVRGSMRRSLEGLIGKNLPIGVTHGDFKFSNLLVDKGSLTGLTDWDLSVEDGVFLMDIFLFKAFELHKNDKSLVSPIQRLTFEGPGHDGTVHGYGRKLGLDARTVSLLGLLTFVYYLNKHFSEDAIKYNIEWREHYIKGGVVPFAKKLEEAQGAPT